MAFMCYALGPGSGYRISDKGYGAPLRFKLDQNRQTNLPKHTIYFGQTLQFVLTQYKVNVMIVVPIFRNQR